MSTWREYHQVWIKWRNTGDWACASKHPNRLEAREAATRGTSTSGGRISRVEVRDLGASTGECIYDERWPA